MAKKDPKKIIEGEVMGALTLQQQLNDAEAELMLLEPFQRLIELRKRVNDKMAQVRKDVASVMIPAYQAGEIGKKIEEPWGSVTVTESDQFEIDEKELPAKFWKKVPDTTKIRTIYQLEGKAPKGTKQSKKFGIMMKFKEN